MTSWQPDVFAALFYRSSSADIDNIADSEERSWTDKVDRGQTVFSVCVIVRVCVCVFLALCVSCGLLSQQAVAFQPHTINMSLWWGRGAPGMLTCGRAALTTIDKRVRWLLVIKIPGGESYIGGHLTSRLAVLANASFLSGSSILLKRVICLLQQSNQSCYCLLAGWSRLGPKMHLITSYQHLKQTWNDMADSNISQIKCNSMNVFPYLFIQPRNILTTSVRLKFTQMWLSLPDVHNMNK